MKKCVDARKSIFPRGDDSGDQLGDPIERGRASSGVAKREKETRTIPRVYNLRSTAKYRSRTQTNFINSDITGLSVPFTTRRAE